MEVLRIKAVISFEKKYWTAIFERIDGKKISIAQKVFYHDPTDSEIYEYVLNSYFRLKFGEAKKFVLQIKRKNYKRIQREIKQELKIISQTTKRETFSQEIMRLDLEKNKLEKKKKSKKEKEINAQLKYHHHQAKKKQKHKGR